MGNVSLETREGEENTPTSLAPSALSSSQSSLSGKKDSKSTNKSTTMDRKRLHNQNQKETIRNDVKNEIFDPETLANEPHERKVYHNKHIHAPNYAYGKDGKKKNEIEVLDPESKGVRQGLGEFNKDSKLCSSHQGGLDLQGQDNFGGKRFGSGMKTISKEKLRRRTNGKMVVRLEKLLLKKS